MFIRVEPKDFLMFSVFFTFNKERPDLEDDQVKAYLTDHGLAPKWERDEELEGTAWRVMYFGGCYIQNHMNDIGAIHRRGVERSLLLQAIDRALRRRPSAAVQRALDSLPPETIEAVTSSLAELFHVESSFDEDKQGYVVVRIKTGQVRREFLKLANDRSAVPASVD